MMGFSAYLHLQTLAKRFPFFSVSQLCICSSISKMMEAKAVCQEILSRTGCEYLTQSKLS